MNESTLVPRQEMSDLDWLARNHHTWPSKADEVVSVGWKYMKVGEPNYVRVNLGAEITKDQWLSRRAELQNKPSWGDAPEWAEWVVQHGTGFWCWGNGEAKQASNDIWYSVLGKTKWTGHAGDVLGDWRDTLEKRPADLSEQAVTARLKEATDNVLAAAPDLMADKYKFEPFVSMEDAATAKQRCVTPSKYTKTIHGVPVDVYDVLQAWGVSNPALQHLIKKALQCGHRGHKDNAQDLQDIIDSAIRAKELES